MLIVPTPSSSNVGCGEARTASFARTRLISRPRRFAAFSTSYVRWVAMAETMTNADRRLNSYVKSRRYQWRVQ
jgi:hypothetical protein